MSVGDVCPKESKEPPNAQAQPSSSTQASPPTQNEVEAQVDEGEDQRDEPPQNDGNDPGGDANDQDKEDVWGTDIPRVHWKDKRPHERPKGPINCKVIPSWAWGRTTSEADRHKAGSVRARMAQQH
jgi:hypothetical protein